MILHFIVISAKIPQLGLATNYFALLFSFGHSIQERSIPDSQAKGTYNAHCVEQSRVSVGVLRATVKISIISNNIKKTTISLATTRRVV